MEEGSRKTHRGLGAAGVGSLTSTGLAAPKGFGLGPVRGTTTGCSLRSSLVSEATEGVEEGACVRGGSPTDRGLRASLGRGPPDWPLGWESKVSARTERQLADFRSRSCGGGDL